MLPETYGIIMRNYCKLNDQITQAVSDDIVNFVSWANLRNHMFKKCINIRYIFFYTLPLLLYFQPIYAIHSNIIRLALLDTPYNEIPSNVSKLQENEKAYFAGINTAAYVVKKYNINIIYKPFIYGSGPIDILSEIPKIKKWHADLILGPGSSDHFIMLKNYLQNVMVLSSYASGQELQSLPSNFHSIFLPDNKIMMLLAEYIHKKFPNKNVYIITQVDSKQCIDASNQFISSYKKISSLTKISENKIILDDINSINSKELIAGHENDVILIFSYTLYSYNELVKHIILSFPNKKLIFFSDQDNWDNTESKAYKDNKNYDSYRIGPIIFDNHSLEFKTFKKAYYNLYHIQPLYSVSYMSYITVISAIEALIKYPSPNKENNMREKILYSYTRALEHDPNWFQINNYGIYRSTSQGETLVARLSIPKQPKTEINE